MPTADKPTVLVTGASGFVGSHVLVALERDGCQAVGLDLDVTRSCRFESANRFERKSVDLLEREAVLHMVDQLKPSVIVHCAWQGVVGSGRDGLDQIDNLTAWKNILEATAKTRTRRIIGLGSQAEYGVHNSRIRESTPTRPDSMYGIVKLAAGQIGKHQSRMRHFEFAWLRLFSTFGPGDYDDYVLPYAIRSLLQGQSPDLTAGEQAWDWLYVEDVARRVARVATAASPVNGVFNLCSGTPMKLREMITRAARLIDNGATPNLGALPYRENAIMLLDGDPTLFDGTFGNVGQTPVDEALQRTIEWFRTNSGEDILR